MHFILANYKTAIKKCIKILVMQRTKPFLIFNAKVYWGRPCGKFATTVETAGPARTDRRHANSP